MLRSRAAPVRAQTQLREGGQLLRQVLGALQQLFAAGEQAVGQPHVQGLGWRDGGDSQMQQRWMGCRKGKGKRHLLSVDGATRQDHVHGAALANQARKAHRACAAGAALVCEKREREKAAVPLTFPPFLSTFYPPPHHTHAHKKMKTKHAPSLSTSHAHTQIKENTTHTLPVHITRTHTKR